MLITLFYLKKSLGTQITRILLDLHGLLYANGKNQFKSNKIRVICVPII
jgi:hypothetical protein